MSDLIDRQEVIDAFYQYPNVNWTTLDVMEKINELPSVQPGHAICYLDSPCEYQNINIALPTVEPKKGCWLDALDEDPCYYRCSECGRLSDFLENFCPNCGAEMRGEEE